MKANQFFLQLPPFFVFACKNFKCYFDLVCFSELLTLECEHKSVYLQHDVDFFFSSDLLDVSSQALLKVLTEM